MLGGGQLGRMFCHASTRMGYRVTVLDPAQHSPAAEVAGCHLRYAYDDPAGLQKLADSCDAVTTEFENVPADSLRWLARHVPVYPPAAAVEIAQDRGREKQFFTDHQLPTNRFVSIDPSTDIRAAYESLGCRRVILKTATLGYDGKGQRICESAAQVENAYTELAAANCILEEMVSLDAEVSVVLARDVRGDISAYPVIENQHRNGILDLSIVPARVPAALAQQAQQLARRLADALDYTGVLALEMFVSNGRLLLNEMAPRPHNSGHITLDAFSVTQFDQQVRTLASLPVAAIDAETATSANGVMLNILGDLLLARDFDWQIFSCTEKCHMHVYGKEEARQGRKMGHANYVGDNRDHLLGLVDAVKQRWPEAF